MDLVANSTPDDSPRQGVRSDSLFPCPSFRLDAQRHRLARFHLRALQLGAAALLHFTPCVGSYVKVSSKALIPRAPGPPHGISLQSRLLISGLSARISSTFRIEFSHNVVHEHLPAVSRPKGIFLSETGQGIHSGAKETRHILDPLTSSAKLVDMSVPRV